jgi:hypothetical protein
LFSFLFGFIQLSALFGFIQLCLALFSFALVGEAQLGVVSNVRA